MTGQSCPSIAPHSTLAVCGCSASVNEYASKSTAPALAEE
jgi:hypothetical protein